MFRIWWIPYFLTENFPVHYHYTQNWELCAHCTILALEQDIAFEVVSLLPALLWSDFCCCHYINTQSISVQCNNMFVLYFPVLVQLHFRRFVRSVLLWCVLYWCQYISSAFPPSALKCPSRTFLCLCNCLSKTLHLSRSVLSVLQAARSCFEVFCAAIFPFSALQSVLCIGTKK